MRRYKSCQTLTSANTVEEAMIIGIPIKLGLNMQDDFALLNAIMKLEVQGLSPLAVHLDLDLAIQVTLSDACLLLLLYFL
jgi:hypothetical protein